MILDPYISITESLVRAWLTRKAQVRIALSGALFLGVAAVAAQGLKSAGILPKEIAEALSGILAVAAGVIVLAVSAYQSVRERDARTTKIQEVEDRALEHPEKPELAWDLARTKLESYLDRNLAQVRSIYWLTLLVISCGFGLILYGLYHAFQEPEKFAVSVVASASGVLVSFIGGSFLLIYRSILAQSKEYVTVLERINAVGMAVQVIASIPEESRELRSRTTADLAKQLLGLYASVPRGPRALAEHVTD
jgi:hypothetical protein